MESQFKDSIDPRLPSDPQVGKKGLVVFPGALGDFVCFLPTLKKIVDREPQTRFELAARPEYAELLYPRDPSLTVRSLDCHPIGRAFGGTEAMGTLCREYLGAFDWIRSWFGASDSAFVRSLKAHYPGHLRILPFRPAEAGVHMADFYFSSLFKGQTVTPLPDIYLNEDAMQWARRYWEEHRLTGKKVLLIAPGSGSMTKNWPTPFYSRVAKWWRTRTGGEALALRGPVEDEQMGNDPIWKELICVRGLSLGQLAVLQSRSDLYLGNDSGSTHMAAALGVVTVALFGPTDPAQWAPRGRNVTVLRTGEACSPCSPSLSRVCRQRVCLEKLVPEQVLGLLEQVLPNEESLTRKSGGLKVNCWEGQEIQRTRSPKFSPA